MKRAPSNFMWGLAVFIWLASALPLYLFWWALLNAQRLRWWYRTGVDL